MPENTFGVTEQIVSAVARAKWDDLPVDVAKHAERGFVNFVGCAVGGSQHEAVKLAERALRVPGEVGSAPVIGRSHRESVQLSALLNCIAASVHAYDDTHAEALVHASSVLGSALIAFSSGLQRVDGREFMLAFAWGTEIMFRLSKSISVAPAKSDIGWSQSGITGAVGAAIACARMAQLSNDSLAQAIGLAASQTGGIRGAHGTMAMHLVPAQAANIGVQSALLAQGGFTGPKTVLEGRHGFLQMFCNEPNLAALTSGLGQRFELMSNTFKAYPCGTVLQGLVDACIELRAEPGFSVDLVKMIELKVAPAAATLGDRKHPDSQFAAQVSAQHWAAIALLDGAAGVLQGSDEAIQRADVAALRERCVVQAVPGMPSDAAEVRITLTEGAVLSRHVPHFWGSLANPMRDDHIDKKFTAQAEPVLGEAASRELLHQCRNIQAQKLVNPAWFAGSTKP